MVTSTINMSIQALHVITCHNLAGVSMTVGFWWFDRVKVALSVSDVLLTAFLWRNQVRCYLLFSNYVTWYSKISLHLLFECLKDQQRFLKFELWINSLFFLTHSWSPPHFKYFWWKKKQHRPTLIKSSSVPIKFDTLRDEFCHDVYHSH